MGEGFSSLPLTKIMPCLEKKGNGRTVRIYFKTEEEKKKYEGWTPSRSTIGEAFDKRRKKACQLEGDRDCLKVYQHEYDKGNYKVFDHTPEQVRTLYKDALMGGLK